MNELLIALIGLKYYSFSLPYTEPKGSEQPRIKRTDKGFIV